MTVNVIGAGLAGCESAWIIAQNGIKVKLFEMKPKKFTLAHKYGGFAELVCSNSLKALDLLQPRDVTSRHRGAKPLRRCRWCIGGGQGKIFRQRNHKNKKSPVYRSHIR